MTIRELSKLSDEELRDISMQKNRIGNATADAYRAQNILQERSGYWPGTARTTSVEATLIQEKGTNHFVKRFK